MHASHPWLPGALPGRYRNPVLHADYSDPDVIRVGADYWMTASSFTCTPGLPILHSRDLVHWDLVGHALRQVPHPRYAAVQPGCGVWAPSLSHHAGRFWIFFPMPDEGIYHVTAEDPRGPWSEPHLVQAARGWIDPCPFWDDDGSAWLAHAYANSRAGLRDRLHIRPMAPDGSRLLGEGREIVHAPHHPYLEGPKVHRFGDDYLVLAPGGGVPTGWQVAFRSKHLLGPYEERIVLERGSTAINGPHQGALIDSPDGKEWFFLHFQDTGPFGRIAHLQPVRWQDGWPLMGVDQDGNGIGEPVDSWTLPSGAPVATEERRSRPADAGDVSPGPTLDLGWQWQANHQDGWVDTRAHPGWLRLLALPQSEGAPDACLAPHFLGRKFPARGFRAETTLDVSRLEPGAFAGLAVVGGGQSRLAGLRRLPKWAGPAAELVSVTDRTPLALGACGTTARLAVEVYPDGRYSFETAAPDGPWLPVPGVCPAREGGWMGARVGLVAFAADGAAGTADFAGLRFLPPTT